MNVELSSEAYRVLCGLVQPRWLLEDHYGEGHAVTADAATWRELAAALPRDDYRPHDERNENGD